MVLRLVLSIALCALALQPATAQSDSVDRMMRDLAGERAPSSNTSPGTAPAPSSSGLWGAIATAIWRRSNGRVRVVSGSAVRFSSKSEAISAAMAECRKRGGGNRCRIRTTWNVGCGYVIIGRRRGDAAWFAGRSIANVRGRCRSKGYDCGKPIGGCL